MTVKQLAAYQFTIGTDIYGVHLDSNTYEDIADSIGFTPMTSPPPANIRMESISKLEGEGRAIKISIGLAKTANDKVKKRRILVLPVGIPYICMLGKTINGLVVKTAKVKTYRTFH
jgi:hypothetical protein